VDEKRKAMKRFWFLMFGVMAFFLLTFWVAETLHIPILTDPEPLLHRGKWLAALGGMVLLLLDVFLPVPSSLVMIAQGALFGIWTGALLSLIGSIGATWLGFYVGRRGGKLLERLVSPAEKAKADLFLQRWGTLAILISRPIPLFAETVAILSGTSPMRFGPMTLAALAGCLPMSILYAITGATAANVSSGFWVFGLVILISGLFWWVGNKLAI
jgi:uncharacterized membrane protein YdjX (TVP38/TMEM64 family)